MTDTDFDLRPALSVAPPPYTRILVAVGDTPEDDAALDAAVALATPRTTLTLLATPTARHWSFLAAAYVYDPTARSPREEAAATVDRAVARTPKHVSVRPLIRTGALRKALAREAAGGGYDLAVMAAPASRRLVRACAAPLLVVPARPAAERFAR